jgi:hypothetical protein
MTTQYNSTERDSSILSNLKLPGTFVATQIPPYLRNIILNRVFRKLLKELKFIFISPNKRSYHSDCLGYDPKLDSLNKPTKLHGYFQTWYYPLFVRDIVSLALNNEAYLSSYAKDLIAKMKSRKILVVHIRLGDYKNSQNSFRGVLSPDYYGAILKRPELKEYQVFVFSDDITDAKSEYSKFFPSNTTWVDEGNTLNPVETLVVMSHGKAFAIANSTFSWWSAFLSQDSEIIIAPTKWFKEEGDPKDLIPSDWHREVSQWIN